MLQRDLFVRIFFHLVRDMTDQMSLLRDNEINIQCNFVCDVVEDDKSNGSSTNSNSQNRVLR